MTTHTLLCTKCRMEKPMAALRQDRKGYYWCDRCNPALWADPKK